MAYVPGQALVESLRAPPSLDEEVQSTVESSHDDLPFWSRRR